MSDEPRFYTTAEVCALLKVSSKTINRRQHARVNPMPAPKIRGNGSTNLYCSQEIEAYIERAIILSSNRRRYLEKFGTAISKGAS